MITEYGKLIQICLQSSTLGGTFMGLDDKGRLYEIEYNSEKGRWEAIRQNVKFKDEEG